MFDTANAHLVGAWGLILGMVGLVVSLLGFWVTIAQLRRTRKATEAVNAAISSLRNRMGAFDFASECVRGSKSLEHAIHLLRAKQWDEAAGKLLESQGILNRIGISDEGDESARNSSRDTAELLLTSVQELEEAADKQIEFQANELIMILRKQINLLESQIVGVNRELYNG
ncbi:MAG TPA: hypothetical protein VF655_11920 [Allosphingosinicella sp.]|jgi:hypothetical protein